MLCATSAVAHKCSSLGQVPQVPQMGATGVLCCSDTRITSLCPRLPSLCHPHTGAHTGLLLALVTGLMLCWGWLQFSLLLLVAARCCCWLLLVAAVGCCSLLLVSACSRLGMTSSPREAYVCHHLGGRTHIHRGGVRPFFKGIFPTVYRSLAPHLFAASLCLIYPFPFCLT